MDFFVNKSHAAPVEKKVDSGSQSAGLPEIVGQLDKIHGLMDETKQRLTDHLLSAPASSGGASTSQIKDLLQPIMERLDGLGMLLSNGASAALPAASGVSDSALKPESSNQVQELFNQQNQALSNAFSALDKKIEDAVVYLTQNLGNATVSGSYTVAAEPAAPVSVPVPESVSVPQAPLPVRNNPVPATSRNGYSREALIQSFLGSDLSSSPLSNTACNQLLDGFLAKDKPSSGLLGLMLQFHSSAPDKMPMLLKDIGEAYYRWQPKLQDDAPFERALANYLCACCEAVGIKNSIDLVSIGSRFDSTCHNATARGVVITNVRGWIVLRDNGKVYTRALVDVQ